MSLEEEKHYLELLNKYLKGTLSDQEKETLHAAAEKDADKAFFYQYLKENREENDAELEVEIIYEKTKPNDLKLTSHTDRKSSNIVALWKKYRLPAIAACLLCFFSFLWFVKIREDAYISTQDWDEMTTAKGERKFFRMNDGTEIWLNSESSLRIKKGYGKQHRILELLGEAHFSVTKNKDLPLFLNALGNEIEVLGTVFNVRAYPEEKKIATSLVEGKVKLHVGGANNKRDYVLNPGDKVEVMNKLLLEKNNISRFKKNITISRITDDDVEYKKIAPDNDAAIELMWVQNKLVFNDDHLENMAKKLERWYDRKIVLETNNLKSESFSGVFQERTCEQVLNLLQKTGGKFKYHVENEIIYIK